MLLHPLTDPVPPPLAARGRAILDNIPLSEGGRDDPGNMQWLPKA
jgi:hypothetical protein